MTNSVTFVNCNFCYIIKVCLKLINFRYSNSAKADLSSDTSFMLKYSSWKVKKYSQRQSQEKIAIPIYEVYRYLFCWTRKSSIYALWCISTKKTFRCQTTCILPPIFSTLWDDGTAQFYCTGTQARPLNDHLLLQLSLLNYLPYKHFKCKFLGCLCYIDFSSKVLRHGPWLHT